jgi:hypothetical protein
MTRPRPIPQEAVSGVSWGHTFKFGVGRNSAEFRLDVQSLLCVWVLATYFSWTSILILISVLYSKPILIATWHHIMDFRQSIRVRNYVNQFNDCRFNTVSLTGILGPAAAEYFAKRAHQWKRKEFARVIVAEPKSPLSPRPGAFSTFFFTTKPSLIFCPIHPTQMSAYQKFILFHELGHAMGSRSSYRVRTLGMLFDCFFGGLLFWLAGISAPWALRLVPVYVAIRIFEWLLGRNESIELFTDSLAYGLLHLDGLENEISRVTELRRMLLLKSALSSSARKRALRLLENSVRFSLDFPTLSNEQTEVVSWMPLTGQSRKEIRHDIGWTVDNLLYDIEERTRMINHGFGGALLSFCLAGLAVICVVILGWNLNVMAARYALVLSAGLVLISWLLRSIAIGANDVASIHAGD